MQIGPGIGTSGGQSAHPVPDGQSHRHQTRQDNHKPLHEKA